MKERCAQLLGKPTAMLAGSPGPFNRDSTLDFAHLVFNNFALVTNREEISKSVLSDFGFDVSNVYSLACPAFEFEPATLAQIQQYIEGTPLANKQKPVIGFVLCGWNLLKGPFSRENWEDQEFDGYIK